MEADRTGRGCAVAVYICVLLVHCSLAKEENFTEKELQKILFDNYNSNVMPNKNKSTPIESTISLHLVSIDNINEKKQSITIRATLGISWKDDYLVWDPDQYVDVFKINVKQEDIWTPDIALKHTFHRPTDLGQSGGRASIRYDGIVDTWPYKLYTVACKIYVAKFPFDKQTCVFIFVPWTNPNTRITLKSALPEPDLSNMSESGEWGITGTKIEEKTLRFENATYDYVYFTFELQRKALYHVINMVVPVMCISSLNIACFLLPSHGGERVTLAISIFLTLGVFLTVVNSSMPESSDEVSAFSVYVCLQLFGSAVAVTFTIVSLTLFHRDDRKSVSWPFKAFIRTCCPQERRKNNASEEKDAAVVHNGNSVDDVIGDVTWRIVSEALDKFCLITSITWHILLTTTLMLSLTQ